MMKRHSITRYSTHEGLVHSTAKQILLSAMAILLTLSAIPAVASQNDNPQQCTSIKTDEVYIDKVKVVEENVRGRIRVKRKE